jgi:hypothetical protein
LKYIAFDPDNPGGSRNPFLDIDLLNGEGFYAFLGVRVGLVGTLTLDVECGRPGRGTLGPDNYVKWSYIGSAHVHDYYAFPSGPIRSLFNDYALAELLQKLGYTPFDVYASWAFSASGKFSY